MAGPSRRRTGVRTPFARACDGVRCVRANPSLVTYNFMFPRDPGDDRPRPRSGQTALLPLNETPCPSCVPLLDQLDGTAFHLAPLINFVVIAKTPVERLLAFGRERGWRYLRLLSSAGQRKVGPSSGTSNSAMTRPALRSLSPPDTRTRSDHHAHVCARAGTYRSLEGLRAPAKLIYLAITSLDGYIEDASSGRARLTLHR